MIKYQNEGSPDSLVSDKATWHLLGMEFGALSFGIASLRIRVVCGVKQIFPDIITPLQGSSSNKT